MFEPITYVICAVFKTTLSGPAPCNAVQPNESDLPMLANTSPASSRNVLIFSSSGDIIRYAHIMKTVAHKLFVLCLPEQMTRLRAGCVTHTPGKSRMIVSAAIPSNGHSSQRWPWPPSLRLSSRDIQSPEQTGNILRQLLSYPPRSPGHARNPSF